MRHFDLTPLYRSTIGFDRLGSLLDTLGAFEGDTPSYPPYNIERVGENEYRISMAVAGFGEKDLTIEVKENTLSIRGEKQTEVEQSTYLHRGIAGRSFERRFQLADHVLVKGANLENGLLHVDLVRELPEAMKPRTIPIETKSDKPRVIDSKAAAPNGFNGGYYRNQQVDRLLAEATRVTDQKKRGDLYRQAAKAIVDDAAWIFVDNAIQNAAATKKVSGFTLHPSFYLFFHTTSVQ